MANNYLKPVNNHFGYEDNNLEDVDDDIFLNNARAKSSYKNASGSSLSREAPPVHSTNPFEEESVEQQRQILEERKRQIEAQTLNSTQKSLGLLYETEEVGKATAVELAKQREQLEKTSRQLEEINATLRFSQRHLNSLKSVFGGLKNYLSGNRDQQQPPSSANSPRSPPNASQAPQNTKDMKQKSPTEKYNNHPVSRLREDSYGREQHVQMQEQKRNNPFEAQLEANLEEMCGNLSRLKGLASDMNREIESQNEFLDNMNYKIEDIDLKMNKQNKDMNKLLGKK